MKRGKTDFGLVSIGLESAARGVLTPILSLILLAGGMSLSQLPMGIAACSLAILMFELPGGILSDRIGRRRIFLTAQFLYLLALYLLMIDQGWLSAVVAMGVYGAARAFSSGSMEALVIDEAILVHGKENLPKITAQLVGVRGGGLAVGALAGGCFYQLGAFKGFAVKTAVGVSMVLTAAAGCVALFLTKETKSVLEKEKRTHFFCTSKKLKLLFTAFVFMGILTSFLETYWQPYLSELMKNDALLWLFGVLSFAYFGITVPGSIAAKQLLKKYRQDRLFPVAYLWSGCCLMILGLTKRPVSFFVWYLIFYLCTAIGDTALSVSVNQEVPSSLRATVLSVQSFLFQLGALGGLTVSGMSVEVLKISGLWMAGAVLFMVGMGVIGILLGRRAP